MEGRTAGDVVHALAFVPGETCMLLRGIRFLKAWAQVVTGTERDDRAAQARVESGAGGSATRVLGLAGLVLVAAAVARGWLQLEVTWRSGSGLLTVGWTVLAVVTIVQTPAMLRKLARRHRAFLVQEGRARPGRVGTRPVPGTAKGRSQRRRPALIPCTKSVLQSHTPSATANVRRGSNV